MLRMYTAPAVLEEINRLQEEMNRVFSRYNSPQARSTSAYPPVNGWVNGDAVVLTAEVPGVRPEDLDISVMGRTLTLQGVRPPEQLPEGARLHRQERSHGRFSRALQLPYEVEADQVEAVFRNGVLTIRLPRAEADKPKKVRIKTA